MTSRRLLLPEEGLSDDKEYGRETTRGMIYIQKKVGKEQKG
jgi:hypothetical protein